MPGVTRSVVKGEERLRRWARALRAAKLAAVRVAADFPEGLIGDAARRERDELGEDIAFLEKATRVTFEVPESAGGDQ